MLPTYEKNAFYCIYINMHYSNIVCGIAHEYIDLQEPANILLVHRTRGRASYEY